MRTPAQKQGEIDRRGFATRSGLGDFGSDAFSL